MRANQIALQFTYETVRFVELEGGSCESERSDHVSVALNFTTNKRFLRPAPWQMDFVRSTNSNNSHSADESGWKYGEMTMYMGYYSLQAVAMAWSPAENRNAADVNVSLHRGVQFPFDTAVLVMENLRVAPCVEEGRAPTDNGM